MTRLRKLTIEEMTRRNFTESTTRAYVRIIEEFTGGGAELAALRLVRAFPLHISHHHRQHLLVHVQLLRFDKTSCFSLAERRACQR